MIRKLANDQILITLGQQTVFLGNAYAPNEEKPFGICFSEKADMSGEAVLIELPNEQAIAEYMTILLQYLEIHKSENTSPKFTETMARLNEKVSLYLENKED